MCVPISPDDEGHTAQLRTPLPSFLLAATARRALEVQSIAHRLPDQASAPSQSLSTSPNPSSTSLLGNLQKPSSCLVCHEATSPSSLSIHPHHQFFVADISLSIQFPFLSLFAFRVFLFFSVSAQDHTKFVHSTNLPPPSHHPPKSQSNDRVS